MSKKTVRELEAEVDALRDLMGKLTEHITTLAGAIQVHNNQIASLQASDLVLADSSKTIMRFLTIDQQPGMVEPRLPGYQ